jgi:cytochrome c-type biogenesis protein CcmH
MEIIFAELILLAVVLGVVLFFMYLPPKTRNTDDNTSNIAINKQKLQELENDLHNGLLSADDYEHSKMEITQSLALEMEEKDENTAITKKPHVLAAITVVIVLAASYIVYQNVKSESQALPKNTIEILEKNVAENPKDSKSWQMLAVSYSLKNQTLKAKQAYEKAYQLGNKDINLLTEYASVLATLNNGDFSGEPAKLVREALEIDARNVKALYLAGIIAANAGMLDLAKGLWQKALSLSKQGSGDEQLLLGVLEQLDEFQNTNQTRDVSISVVVDIPEDIYQQRVDDFIMIYAKNATGRPMPIAIVKEKLADFTGIVNLSDAHSVMPNTQLSDATEIIVVVRISKTGNAIRQKGDIEKASSVLQNGSQSVEISF